MSVGRRVVNAIWHGRCESFRVNVSLSSRRRIVQKAICLGFALFRVEWLGGEKAGVGGVAEQKGVAYDDGSHLIGHPAIGGRGGVDLRKQGYKETMRWVM